MFYFVVRLFRCCVVPPPLMPSYLYRSCVPCRTLVILRVTQTFHFHVSFVCCVLCTLRFAVPGFVPRVRNSSDEIIFILIKFILPPAVWVLSPLSHTALTRTVIRHAEWSLAGIAILDTVNSVSHQLKSAWRRSDHLVLCSTAGATVDTV